ncbi:MAG: biotin/lipoyl-binding protein [Microbispora sp.]|nr:biotin/lipoyl-binding protein [Microbispora sp.]
MVSRILVANRGEIAARIVRTCAELGITSIAVYAGSDRDALHVRLADESVDLGGATARDGYLAIDRIIAAAKDSGADAIHPGYGFLAENADFAAAVESAGLVFIGPPASAIATMGDKVAARRVAEAAGAFPVPGTLKPVETVDEVLAFGAAHGYPLAVKASFGGGGRGMRVVTGPDEAGHAFEAARREATGAFGRGEIYLERYLGTARHIEVQIFADTHGDVVWLGDRDCSVQRRHQKLIEESPAPGLPPELRRSMGEAAVRIARHVGYVGAGTVEFLVEEGDFYFLEMNTRIQVEHPVTEEVLGLDLIAEQIRVAAGEPLSVRRSGPEPRGHAIELRINAEDPAGGRFLPSPGRITVLEVPHGPGVRWDTGYEAGDEVSGAFDSLIGKLVVWAPDRITAIRRALAALRRTRIEGPATTVAAHLAVLRHPRFVAGGVTTRWLESEVELPAETTAAGPRPADAPCRSEVWIGGRRHLVPFHGPVASAPKASALPADGRAGGPRRTAGRAAPSGDGTVTSPMQGTVTSVSIAENDRVRAGDVLFIVEAMKMENPVRATVSGAVAELRAAVGAVVAAGDVLAVIRPDETPES